MDNYKIFQFYYLNKQIKFMNNFEKKNNLSKFMINYL